MKCSSCKNKAAVRIKPLYPLCKSCFCRVITKRIRKDARINKWFKKGDKIYADTPLLQHLINKIIPNLPKKIVKTKNITNKIIISSTTDDIIAASLDNIFHNKKIKLGDKKEIPLLRSITDEEVATYARFQKIPFKPKQKNKDLLNFINIIQEKHAETKSSLVKSIIELQSA